MAGKLLFDKNKGVRFTPAFDSVSVAFGASCSLVLGKIARYCEMRSGVCKKSKDDLAFQLGLSEKTVETSIKTLVANGIVIDNTPLLRVPHSYSVNQEKLVEFDYKYRLALGMFEQFEQHIIKNADPELRKKYTVSRVKRDGSVTQKLLRRYVKFSFVTGKWYVKISHIIKNINKEINKETLNQFLYDNYYKKTNPVATEDRVSDAISKRKWKKLLEEALQEDTEEMQQDFEPEPS